MTVMINFEIVLEHGRYKTVQKTITRRAGGRKTPDSYSSGRYPSLHSSLAYGYPTGNAGGSGGNAGSDPKVVEETKEWWSSDDYVFLCEVTNICPNRLSGIFNKVIKGLALSLNSAVFHECESKPRKRKRKW